MKRAFREWYAYSDEEQRSLWSEAFITLDANVLLGLYQYPDETRAEFVRVLRHLQEQLWMPHQVGLEYHRNREARVPEQRARLDRLLDEIASLRGSLSKLAIPDYHPILDVDETRAGQASVDDALEALSAATQEARDETPATPAGADDPILEELTDLYDGRVGPEFSSGERADAVREADERYREDVPPGYKDREKDERRRYNDYFIWKQILQHARALEPKQACIFVTNDRKEDWWRRRQEQLIGPRTELIREYRDAAGAAFAMYTPEGFLDAARAFRLKDVSRDAIEVVRQASVSTPVADALRWRQMVLPPPEVREAAIARLYDRLVTNPPAHVGDVSDAIRTLGEGFATNYVQAPLFFSLINETYGLVRAPTDRGTRLRDRPILGIRAIEDRGAFLTETHVAWLAQALYRVQHDFTEDELFRELWGDDPPGGATLLFRRAIDAASRDEAYRKRDPES